jgi:small basic protein
MLKIILGLVCVMVANILFGTTVATIQKEFKWEKFWNGFFKCLFIVVGCSLMYLCSYLNSDIMIANINGMNVNLIDGMKLLFIAGIVLYGYKDIVNVKKLLGVSTDIKEPEKVETIEIPIENEIGGKND